MCAKKPRQGYRSNATFIHVISHMEISESTCISKVCSNNTEVYWLSIVLFFCTSFWLIYAVILLASQKTVPPGLLPNGNWWAMDWKTGFFFYSSNWSLSFPNSVLSMVGEKEKKS